MNFKRAVLTLFAMTASANAGLITYGLCQTGCNTVAVARYAAAGATFGTVVAAAAAPPAIIACNSALGTCSAMCAKVALLAPTP